MQHASATPLHDSRVSSIVHTVTDPMTFNALPNDLQDPSLSAQQPSDDR